VPSSHAWMSTNISNASIVRTLRAMTTISQKNHTSCAQVTPAQLSQR